MGRLRQHRDSGTKKKYSGKLPEEQKTESDVL